MEPQTPIEPQIPITVSPMSVLPVTAGEIESARQAVSPTSGLQIIPPVTAGEIESARQAGIGETPPIAGSGQFLAPVQIVSDVGGIEHSLGTVFTVQSLADVRGTPEFRTTQENIADRLAERDLASGRASPREFGS